MQNPITATTDYIRTSIAELKKVTWPTKDQTIRYSALVIAVSVAVAAFFASLDFGFSRGIMFALSKTAHSSAQPAETETPVTPDVAPLPDVQATPEGSQGITVTPSAPEEQPETPVLPATDGIQLPKN